MGLDISHDAYHGAYSSFNRFRSELAKVSGFPELEEMEGFSGTVSWEPYLNHPLYELLNHSDCDGSIEVQHLGPMANYLESKLTELDKLEEGWGHLAHVGNKTRGFIKGCRLAIERNERLEFH